MTLSRRNLLGAGLAAGAAASLVPGMAAGQRRSSNAARFALGYAPHEGSFASRGGRIEQIAYAASDVLHLHALRDRLDAMLVREGRDHLARACFDFLPHRALLDVAGWEEVDIFAHM